MAALFHELINHEMEIYVDNMIAKPRGEKSYNQLREGVSID